MTKAPQAAYKLQCQRALRGAYFPLIQANEQAAVTIVGISDGNTWSLPCSHATISRQVASTTAPLKPYFFQHLISVSRQVGYFNNAKANFQDIYQ